MASGSGVTALRRCRAFGIEVVLDVLAVISIVTTLRWLWRHQHRSRWQYLPVAAALIVLVIVLSINDVQALLA